MGSGKTKVIRTRVTDDVHSALSTEAQEDNRTIANHVENILTAHVWKKEVKRPHTPKREYGS